MAQVLGVNCRSQGRAGAGAAGAGEALGLG